MSNTNNQRLSAAKYVRVSTEEQCEWLLEEQLFDLKRYVKQNKDFHIPAPSKGRVK
ncbi:recombinase family protein [Paenibacillus sp. FSL H7-0350]|uniref:recombinase family protein n=1 Tax=Paenibacillus sp. FSL H7-0350 TaxID=2975345 RepID=UPI0031587D32